MKPKFFIGLFLFFLLLFCVTIPSWPVESSNPKAEQSYFTLEVTDNLINLSAQQASFKEILIELEKKTGIKVKIFDGVKDKKVSLNITSLPVYAVHTLLEKMDIENFAVVYDRQLSSKVIYILPVGQDINEIIKDKTKSIIFSTHIIDVEVAKLVAEEYLPKYYPGDWIFFDSHILYDLEGIPFANAIIFRDVNSTIVTVENLKSSMKEIHVKIDRKMNQILRTGELRNLPDDIKRDKIARLQKTANKLERTLYQSEIFATVITGATETSSPLIRCYKGLPSFLVKRPDIEMKLSSEYQDNKLQLGRVLYFSPFDIRYEVKKEDDLGVVPSLEGKLSQLVSDNSYTIFIDNDEIKLLSVVSERQRLKEQLDRKKNARNKMSIEKKRLLEESDKKKRQHYMAKWDKYKREYIESLGQ